METRLRTVLAVLIAYAVLAVGAVAVPSADAQTSFNEAHIAFGGVNGEAQAVQSVGDELWVGGEFLAAFDVTDTVTEIPRANLAVFDLNTGELLPFAPNPNGEVQAIETDDSSTIWVGGEFTEIAGQGIAYIVAFDAFTGEVDPNFSVTLDAEINTLHLADGWLYIAGEFGQVNGLTYTKMARVNAASGELDINFRPNPDITVRDIDSFGDRVYAAGLFEEVGLAPNNYQRRWMAGFDIDTGQPAGPEFEFSALGRREAEHRAGLWRIQISSDGNYLYTADRRNFLIKWDRLTGEQVWRVQARGDIQAIAIEGSSIYAGTHEGFLESYDERLLFALNTDGAADDTFQPLLDSFLGVLEIELAQGALIAVGDFTTVNGQPSPRVAIFHGSNWNGAQPLVPPVLPGDVGCDLEVNVADSLLIAQFSVGSRTLVESCPLADPTSEMGPGGDVNGDGVINVTDALLIAQCSVGLPNVFCPDE